MSGVRWDQALVLTPAEADRARHPGEHRDRFLAAQVALVLRPGRGFFVRRADGEDLRSELPVSAVEARELVVSACLPREAA